MCDAACCNKLDADKGTTFGGSRVLTGGPPKHDCPLSECSSNVDTTTGLKAPVGLRILHEVMHLRGEATFFPVGDAAEDDFHPSVADPNTGRHTVSTLIPFNNQKTHFLALDPTDFRSIAFVQAGEDADTFGQKPGDDGNPSEVKTWIDVGYHGKGAFASCIFNASHVCGCEVYNHGAMGKDDLDQCTPLVKGDEWSGSGDITYTFEGAGNIEAVHKASAGGCNAFDFRAAGALFAVVVAAAMF